MGTVHRLQQRRFELKYLLDPVLVAGIRDFLRGPLELDEFGARYDDLAYPVHSLYLDSDDLKTYGSSINGTKNRFKLRLRYYDALPQTPVFFEVKARVDNCILKQRCGVRREAVPLLLAGQLPEPEHLMSREPRHLAALQRFNLLMGELNARPKAHNSYFREAWVSPYDDSVRVTFDREIRIEPCFLPGAVIEMKRPIRVFPEFVVLELKFTERFPNWMRDMVRTFNLMQFSSAKYAEGVTLLGEHRFHHCGEAVSSGEMLWHRSASEWLPETVWPGAMNRRTRL
ncbi:MAG TPA: polyphosphate polymerase domain-containing protein [Candidatus Dormibacteraeota bacterium]|nr:polyphosphate polymerase domain-containing protein [Candidatus Dormibacteraeota bacterium]